MPRTVDFREPTGTGQSSEAKGLSQHEDDSDKGEEGVGAALSLELSSEIFLHVIL